MELKRRVRDRMYFVLFIVWNIATVLLGQDLDCTNDFVNKISCHLKAQNCSAYKLTLRKNDNPRNSFNCTFEQCLVGQCCCSAEVDRLIPLETYEANILEGGINKPSKTISISDSIKPQTPTITTVKESNGNIQVKWKTNIEGALNEELISYLAYRKIGDTRKVIKVEPTTSNGENCFEILGSDLEPSTTYMFSVISSSKLSKKDSDISEEYEFTTPMSHYTLPLVITISLSFAAVITTAAIYVCYAKLKRKWGDTVAKSPNPKLLITHQTEQEVLKPLPLLISSVCVEPIVPEDSKPWSKESLRDISCLSPQQSSGISTGSSCLSYANTEPAEIIACVQDALTKAFANISPVSPMTTNPQTESIKDSGLLSLTYNPCDVREDSGSSGFDNKTYSILVPCCPHQNVTDSTEVQMQAEMLCDSAYHSSAGNSVTCFVQQAPADLPVDLPPVALSTVPTDMSYQQCAIDSGGFSCPEDSGFSSASSGTNPVGEGRCGSFDEAVRGAATPHGKAEGVAVFDENPSCRGVPAGSGSLPPVDDDYQPFHNLVEDSEALFSEERSAEKEEHLNKYSDESITQRPQSVLSPVFINNVQGGQCLSELQRPFLSLIPAEQSPSLIIDSGYKAVMDMC